MKNDLKLFFEVTKSSCMNMKNCLGGWMVMKFYSKSVEMTLNILIDSNCILFLWFIGFLMVYE